MTSETEGRPGINKAYLAVGILFCLLLGWAELHWPSVFTASQPKADASLPGFLPGGASVFNAGFVEALKLAVAGLVGFLLASVHRHYYGDRIPNKSLMQAEILLCISGALMMIIIGNSAARALGIAGGASIIRFRTPVDDPRDTIVLFLMLGLGMSVGLGAFVVCGLATMFLCLFLALLAQFGDDRPRVMLLELVASSKDFPAEHVHDTLRRTVRSFEPLKMAQGNEAAMRYQVKIDPSTPLHYLTLELLAGGASGLKSVSWEPPKRSEQM
jgi:hypothetical protein